MAQIFMEQYVLYSWVRRSRRVTDSTNISWLSYHNTDLRVGIIPSQNIHTYATNINSYSAFHINPTSPARPECRRRIPQHWSITDNTISNSDNNLIIQNAIRSIFASHVIWNEHIKFDSPITNCSTPPRQIYRFSTNTLFSRLKIDYFTWNYSIFLCE